jgi:hypothetical protein
MPKPRRFIVAADNHGDMVCKETADALWSFMGDFKPEIRVHAGDLHDLRNLRRGATDDEKAGSLEDDWNAGFDFAERFFKGGKENHLLFGNHDCRIEMGLESWTGVKRDYAGQMIKQRDYNLRKLKVKAYPYDSRKGVLQLGHLRVVHGYHCGVSAAAQHARIYGNVLFGHVHSIESYQVPGLDQREARAIGCMCNVDMGYINSKTAKLRWANGWAYGHLFPDGTYQLFQARKINGRIYAANEIKAYS